MGVYSGPEGPVLCRVVMGDPRIAPLSETTAWTAHGVRGAFRDRSTNGFVTRFQIHEGVGRSRISKECQGVVARPKTVNEGLLSWNYLKPIC